VSNLNSNPNELTYGAKLLNLNSASDLAPFGIASVTNQYQEKWTTAEESGGPPRPLHEGWDISSGAGSTSVIARVLVTAGKQEVGGQVSCAFSAVVEVYKR
jgi:hypothetical protein